MEFKTFDFHPLVEAGVKAEGYIMPTPIQQQAIPLLLNGRDIMGPAGKSYGAKKVIRQKTARGSR